MRRPSTIPRFFLPSLPTVRARLPHPCSFRTFTPKLFTTEPSPCLFTSPTPRPSSSESTIYALSTPPGRSAIAIIRVSGPLSLPIFHTITRCSEPPRPRRAYVHPIYSASHILDPGALVLFFPGPNSHTGTDLLELHVHGSPAIIRAVLAELGEHATPAGPGEFTKRAFLNGRLSLPEVEILGDTLSAVTEQQRRRAVTNTRNLTEIYQDWRAELLCARGELEAIIDFSEDQSFYETPAELLRNVSALITDLKKKLAVYDKNAMRGELLRAGIQLAIVGAPNVGKSSLLNRVLEREAAIVSDEAGTTRDVLDAQVDIGGFLCVVADTAGLREGAGKVEAEGIRRALKRAESADFVVGVVDATRWGSGVEEIRGLVSGRQSVVVINKIDLIDPEDLPVLLANVVEKAGVGRERVLTVSTKKENGGVSELLEWMAGRFEQMTEADGSLGMEESIAATERQRVLVKECLMYLQLYESLVEQGGGTEGEVDFVLAAEELRGAARALGKVLGLEGGDVEDVLGVVFERFCVGK